MSHRVSIEQGDALLAAWLTSVEAAYPVTTFRERLIRDPFVLKKGFVFPTFSPLRRMWFPPSIIFWRCAIYATVPWEKAFNQCEKGSRGEKSWNQSLWELTAGASRKVWKVVLSICFLPSVSFSIEVLAWQDETATGGAAVYRFSSCLTFRFLRSQSLLFAVYRTLSLSLRRCCFDENAAFCESFVDNLVLSLSLSRSLPVLSVPLFPLEQLFPTNRYDCHFCVRR